MVRYSFLSGISLAGLFLALLLIPSACSEDASQPIASTAPRIRVLLAEDLDHADLSGDGAAIALDSRPLGYQLSAAIATPISLDKQGWHMGRSLIPNGILKITPGDSALTVNGIAYRGEIRLIPTTAGRFNIINDIDVEDYLAGVVTREMYPTWPLEAIKAQAVASRTYALYETHAAGVNRAFDVFGDERSQMYGGLSAETSKSREAVQETQGIVLTYGPGDGVIFKAYFSSCCGGVTQAAADAFPGDPYIPPLAEKSNGACCNACKYYNWGPITISKSELTRRFHVWAQRQSQEVGHPIAELNMAPVYRIDIQQLNRYGRPNRVLITDTHGVQFSWPAEQLRSAVNVDPKSGPTLPSSYCKINGDPNSSSVTFYEGHGFGHGVGMCQWCAEAHAAAGDNFAQILVDAYPQTKLVRAY
jgi:stage II sporulation protein D